MQRLGRAPRIPTEGSPAWPAGAARDKESNDSQLSCGETPWGWEFVIPALWQLGEGSPRVLW